MPLIAVKSSHCGLYDLPGWGSCSSGAGRHSTVNANIGASRVSVNAGINAVGIAHVGIDTGINVGAVPGIGIDTRIDASTVARVASDPGVAGCACTRAARCVNGGRVALPHQA